MPDGPELFPLAGAADHAPHDDGQPPPARPASWLNRPAVPGLIALGAALAFALARLQTWAKGNIGQFILVGRHFSTPAQLPHGIPVAPTYGYDGQFFYRLALNPLNLSRTAYGITMDRPYRYMRIGYPALTWLASAGQHSLVPVMLVAVNIAAIGAMGYLGGVFAIQGGRPALAGLLLPGYFGVITSLSRDTAEPLAAACLLAGLLAVRARRPVLAAVLLAYGALTRETVMVAVAALAIVRVVGMLRRRVRPGRDDLAWVVPAVAFAAWQAIVKAATGSIPLLADGGRNAGAPFIAPLQAFRSNLSHFNTHQFDQYDLWFLELAILVAFSVAALLCLRSTSAPLHERLAFVLYLVEICVVTPSTWGSLDADLRSFIEAYLLAVVILLGAPRRSIAWWLLPTLAAFTLPALIVVTQRRLTISLPREPGQQVLVPDQDRVGADTVDPGRPAERGQHGPLGGEARIPGHAREQHDEVGGAAARVVPCRVGLAEAGHDPAAGRGHGPDPDPVAAGQRDHVRLPVAGQAIVQMPGLEPGGELLVLRGGRRLAGFPGQAGQVAEQHGEQHRPQPRRLEPAGQQAPGQGRRERQHGRDLAGLGDHAGLAAEHVDGQVEGHAGDQQPGDQIAVAPEPAYRQPRSPGRQEHAGQVQHGEGGVGGQAHPQEVGTAQEQQALAGDAQVGQEHRAAPDQLPAGSRHVEPAAGVDDVQREHGGCRAGQRGRAQSQLIPLRRQRPALDGHRPRDAGRAHRGERQHPDVEHEHVRDHGPAQERAGDDRGVPAPPGTIQDQPDHHHRYRRADVVR
jgi:hypothetical protein